MNSYILVSPDDDRLQVKLQELCTSFGIDVFDQTTIAPTEKGESLKIEHVRKMQEKAFLKPFKGETKAIILKNCEALTIQAQNALLRLLEEPPPHTYIFLLTSTVSLLLPTILSRCQIIRVSVTKELTPEEEAASNTLLDEIATLSVGSALKRAEKLAKNKDEAIASIRNMLIVGEGRMHKTTTTPHLEALAKQLTELQKAYALLTTTNANPRLVLEHLLLSLSSDRK